MNPQPNQQPAHSPTALPWSLNPTRFPDGRNGWTLVGNDERGNRNVPVAEIPEWFFRNLGTPDQHAANAAYIVKACNSHQALVDALRSAIRRLEYLGSEETGRCAATENARQALRSATQ